MRAGAVHSAPSGAFGMSMLQAGSGPGETTARNASEPLSGAHRICDGGFSSRVIWLSAPSASIQRTNTCDPRGSPDLVKAMRVPSGDQRGPAPSARKRLREPSAPMTQSSLRTPSATGSTKRRS